MKSFFAELKRRNVVRMAGLYLVGAWLIVQVAGTLLPMFGAPEWAARSVVIVVALGFLPAVIFSWAFELTPSGLKRDEEVEAEQSIGPQTGRRMDRMIIAVLVVAVGYFCVDKFVLTARREAAALLSANARAQTILDRSIAVLPLVNTSGDPANEYFSDGLSEELIAVLAKIPGLKIIGRSSSFLFKGKSDDSRAIGEKLGVTNLIEGSVRKQGDRVRIVAELINAADGRALWSDTYDRELKDVFAVQNEIATAVAEELKIKLLGAPAKSDAAPSNDNLSAYSALQQGAFYIQQSSEAGGRKAAEFYAEAVRLDPHYALAYAGLSAAWRQLGASWLRAAETPAAYARARSAAQTALSLSPDLSAAHEALGYVFLTPDLNFAAAESEFRQAEKLAPADAGPKGALAVLLHAQGKLAEAESMTRQALTLDPLSVRLYSNLARVLIARDRYDEAQGALHKALELQPAAARPRTFLAIIALLRGNAAAALQEAQLESPGFWRDYALTLAQQAGDRAQADRALQKFIEGNSVNGPFQIATVYGLRKEPDPMFEWLERAYTEHDSGLTQLVVTPFLLTYRTDPRFAALCQKLKVQVPPPGAAQP